MKSTILALFVAGLLASALDVAAGARPLYLDEKVNSRKLAQFEVTSNLSPLDTYALFTEPGTGRAFVQAADSPLFSSGGGDTVLGLITKGIFKALEGGAAGTGTILEKVIEKAKEDDR